MPLWLRRILYAPEGEGGGGGGGEEDGGDTGDIGEGGDEQVTFTNDLPDNWFNGIEDEEVRSYAGLKDIKTVSDLAKKTMHAERSLGDRIKIPTTDASEDDWNAFHSQLGRPDEPDGYEIPAKDMPESFKADDARVTGFREIAHKLGLSKRQFAGLLRWDAEIIEAAYQTIREGETEAFKQTEAAVTKVLGEAHDDRLTEIEDMLAEYGGEDLIKDLMAAMPKGDKRSPVLALGNPAVIGVLGKVAKALGEDTIHGRSPRRQMGKLTPDEAKRERDVFLADKENDAAYHDRSHRRHKEVVDRVRELDEMVWPNEEGDDELGSLMNLPAEKRG